MELLRELAIRFLDIVPARGRGDAENFIWIAHLLRLLVALRIGANPSAAFAVSLGISISWPHPLVTRTSAASGQRQVR